MQGENTCTETKPKVLGRMINTAIHYLLKVSQLTIRPYLLDLMLRRPNRLSFCMNQKNNEKWITWVKVESQLQSRECRWKNSSQIQNEFSIKPISLRFGLDCSDTFSTTEHPAMHHKAFVMVVLFDFAIIFLILKPTYTCTYPNFLRCSLHNIRSNRYGLMA